MLVVANDTCPSQARIVLMSTPARNRCVAVVCRIVCGLTPLPANDGIVFATAAAYVSILAQNRRKRPESWSFRGHCQFAVLPSLRHSNPFGRFSRLQWTRTRTAYTT